MTLLDIRLTGPHRSSDIRAMVRAAGMTGGVAALSRRVLDAVLPPRCLACGRVVETPGALCPTCWPAFDFAGPPHCACCGFPFPFDLGANALCGDCLRQAPAFRKARFVMRYDDTSKGLILGFKHGDRTDVAPAFGQWLRRAGADLLPTAEFIVPVPLHRFRLFARRYNQSALLAQELGRLTDLPVALDLLLRQRATRPQGRLSRAARRRNVAGAFAVARAWRPRLAGRRVLLIDDVMTTGATVSACAGVLCRAGAAAVDVLVLARVVHGRSGPTEGEPVGPGVDSRLVEGRPHR